MSRLSARADAIRKHLFLIRGWRDRTLLHLRAAAGRVTDDSHQRVGPLVFHINDATNFLVSYKDIFERRIYHFVSKTNEPLVLDCGSNIGLSIAYFKTIYPAASIIGFEADARVYELLSENVVRNSFEQVELVRAAVTDFTGTATLLADHKYESSVVFMTEREARDIEEVAAVRLRDYLDQDVAFLKLNIEGAEYSVLKDCSDKLSRVSEMVVEYHWTPEHQQDLFEILEILDSAGFQFVIHDFDEVTNPVSHPPFSLRGDVRYFLLIYAYQAES